MIASGPCIVLLALLLLAALCSAHYQADLGSLLQFDPFQLAANPHYPQLQCTATRASWADLQQRFPLKSGVFEAASKASSCEQLARSVKEPFHASQLLRNRPILPWPAAGIPGGVPKALCRLGPQVSQADFQAVPSKVLPKAAAHLRHYRVLRGRLYVKGEHSHYWQNHDQLEGYEELLLLAVYLYQVPDMELHLSHGDEPVSHGPVLQYAMDLRANISGCAMPYKDSWRDGALSLQQSMHWAACIAHRYPRASRKQRVVWRGSTTDPHTQPINLRNALALARVRLHMLGLVHGDVLDVKVSGIVQASEGQQALEALLGTGGNSIPFEDFQGYGGVLDMDGNSFSRRLHQLAQMGGPVLKQASPFPSYFEHLFAPGAVPIQYFANNLTDVVQQARVLLGAASQEPRPNTWDDAVDNMHAVAAITLNKWSMIESVAYSLQELARHNAWAPTDALGFSVIPWTKCCSGGGGLPQELLAAMRAAEAVEGPQQAAVYSAADHASAASVLAAFAAASRRSSSDGSGNSANANGSSATAATVADGGNNGSSGSSGGGSSSSSNSSSSSSPRFVQAGLSARLRAAATNTQLPIINIIALAFVMLLSVGMWAMVAAGLCRWRASKGAAPGDLGHLPGRISPFAFRIIDRSSSDAAALEHDVEHQRRSPTPQGRQRSLAV